MFSTPRPVTGHIATAFLEKVAREDIDNLKATTQFTEKKQDDTKDALDKKIKYLDGKIAELADKERKINQALDDLNTKDLYLEAR